MVKFKWPPDKTLLQRMILLSIIGAISYGILSDYVDYYKQVSEYMQSMAYHQARESSKDYNVSLMKRNQQQSPPDNHEPSTKN